MIGIPKTERLLNLVSFLLKSRKPMSFREISIAVDGYRGEGADAKTIERLFERDKATLREMGVPLRFVGDDEDGGPGYAIPRDAYFLPHIELTGAEAAILSLAGRFALASAAAPISEALTSALRKLQFDSPIPGEIRDRVEEQMLFTPGDAAVSQREQEALRQITSAVMARRAIAFSYLALDQKRAARRQVEPYGIGFAGGHWYLAGRDRCRKEMRVFRVDRMRGRIARLHPDATQSEFEVPADFRIQDHIGLPPWLFGKALPVTVRLRFDGRVAFMIRRQPALGDKWETRADGSEVLTRTVTNLDALLNWTLGFGNHVTVLEPASFRKQVAATVRLLAKMHGGRGATHG